jgi:hypothetical protein
VQLIIWRAAAGLRHRASIRDPSYGCVLRRSSSSGLASSRAQGIGPPRPERCRGTPAVRRPDQADSCVPEARADLGGIRQVPVKEARWTRVRPPIVG